MHSQKRGLLRPHSAGGSWLGGPLPMFVMLALLIVGMYFFYSYNTQGNELEVLRQKQIQLERNNRRLLADESILKAKVEKLKGDLASAQGTAKSAIETKEKECESEMSKLRAEVLEEKNNFKKVDGDAKDSQRTIEKLRDELTECRANTSALVDHGTQQEETIQRLNQTILSSLSSVKQTKTEGAVGEKAEEAKPIDQVGANERVNNTEKSEKNTDGKSGERSGGEKVVEQAANVPANVAVVAQSGNEDNASLVGQKDKQGDKRIDSNARLPVDDGVGLKDKKGDKQIDSDDRLPQGDGVGQTNRTATEAKLVGDDSAVAPKQPINAEVAFKKPTSESKVAPAAGGVEDDKDRDRRDKDEKVKPAELTNVSAEKKGADDNKKEAGDDKKTDNSGRSQNGAEETERGVGRAPPSSKDTLIGDDEKDNQVKPPKVDPKSADYQNEEAQSGTTDGTSRTIYSADAREANKPLEVGKEQDDGGQGAVEFEDDEERANRPPAGRYNRGASGA